VPARAAGEHEVALVVLVALGRIEVIAAVGFGGEAAVGPAEVDLMAARRRS